ncbi:MAG: molybdopterin-synthase adenylyltransferase MoeB [Hyphomonadaceae bacterium]|nr:molybdopterin-synthase adenylyltransferase MoeB [Hyphomonadaceae bacterium]
MSSLTPQEAERYRRHILLKEIGGPGQQRLKAAHVAIVGVGGLGAPAALYLAAAGVGRLTLIDPDEVALSNLQRQVIYRASDVGAGKVSAAAQRLQALNPHTHVEARRERLDQSNAEALLHGATAALDGTDDFATRFGVNDAAHRCGIPLVSGAVGRWNGQVGVFASGLTRNAAPADRLPCYRCFVPEAPPDTEPCALAGIVGALTGVIGAMMALETIKIIAGAGETLAGRVLLYDGLGAQTRTVRLPVDPDCATCGRS